ncbi:unnamed protein product [Pleuronectes platessa]|uniref:Uncharacterized protein n=1 Tax=Pleuronectes platessa TaxID=8262 RepID=A0A9N7YFI5_PLEPL|nr:unnamed protein product [Pleuronectes platessa]
MGNAVFNTITDENLPDATQVMIMYMYESSSGRRTAMAAVDEAFRRRPPPPPLSRSGCRGDSDRFAWKKPFRFVRRGREGRGGELGCRERDGPHQHQQQRTSSCIKRRSSVRTNRHRRGWNRTDEALWVSR